MSPVENKKILIGTIHHAMDKICLAAIKQTYAQVTELTAKQLEWRIIERPHDYFTYRICQSWLFGEKPDPKRIADKVKAKLPDELLARWNEILEKLSKKQLQAFANSTFDNRPAVLISLPCGTEYNICLESLPSALARARMFPTS